MTGATHTTRGVRVATRGDAPRSSGTATRDVPTSQKQVQTERMGGERGVKAARNYIDLEPLPHDAVRDTHTNVPNYSIPPQNANAQRARTLIGFGGQPAEVAIPPPGGHHRHLPSLFGSHHDERRYQAPKPLDEWEKGRDRGFAR